MLEAGCSVMADKGFDMAEYLIPRGIQLNIPPFLRRIASLRIHVERAMERIKNFNIFDQILPATLTSIAD